jgi:hypothetical protein
VTAAGKQWQGQELEIGDVRRHPDFQMRADGVDRTHANQLLRVIRNGGDLPAIKVAKVGRALYVVDGHHRLDAYERDGRETIQALVAKMNLAEAKAEARQANTDHGKGLNRADKDKRLRAFIAAGDHLDASGKQKSTRTIEAEMNSVVSYETIRKKMKAWGYELDEATEFPHGYKPYGGGDDLEDDEDLLAIERAEGAERHLSSFQELFYFLPDDRQRELLGTARALVDALEIGERPERAGRGFVGLPDI